MRWSRLRIALLAIAIASALGASLAAARTWRGQSDVRLVNVGGASNSCQCTQRIER